MAMALSWRSLELGSLGGGAGAREREGGTGNAGEHESTYCHDSYLAQAAVRCRRGSPQLTRAAPLVVVTELGSRGVDEQ